VIGPDQLQDVSYSPASACRLDGRHEPSPPLSYLASYHSPHARRLVLISCRHREHTLCYFAGSPADHPRVRGRGARQRSASFRTRWLLVITCPWLLRPNAACARCAPSRFPTRRQPYASWSGGRPKSACSTTASATAGITGSATSDLSPDVPRAPRLLEPGVQTPRGHRPMAMPSASAHRRGDPTTRFSDHRAYIQPPKHRSPAADDVMRSCSPFLSERGVKPWCSVRERHPHVLGPARFPLFRRSD